jgi:hypothetical protein
MCIRSVWLVSAKKPVCCTWWWRHGIPTLAGEYVMMCEWCRVVGTAVSSDLNAVRLFDCAHKHVAAQR